MLKIKILKIEIYLLMSLFITAILFIFFPKFGSYFQNYEKDFIENINPEKMSYSIPNSKKLKSIENGGVILFFETWCPSCMIEMSGIEYIASQKIPIVAVYSDSDEDIINKLKENVGYKHINFVYDNNEELSRYFDISSIPATFIVNSNGSISYKISGSRFFFKNSVINFIKNLSNKK
ncbi:TlpA family protein disulfide reductase [bacterium]|nr:TlpA family protein disulfide reductase [bacterium]